MAGVTKRKSDKLRGKAGKWTAWWYDENGKQVTRAAFTDKAKSLEYARDMERECRLRRDGLVDPAEQARRAEGFRPAADQVAEYAAHLAAEGDTPKYVAATRSQLLRLLADAGVGTLAELDGVKVQAALGRIRETRSARTANSALVAVRAFARWCHDNDRLKDVPRGLAALDKANEAEDRRRLRRALAPAELARLLAATEAAPDHYLYGHTRSKVHRLPITGAERACLYRLAMGTGFRAEELRTLTPDRFDLGGAAPAVTVLACYAKNGKEAVQPITPELAAGLRPFVEGKPPGVPVIRVPEKTARMLRRDMGAAGIPYQDDRGRVVDFHALRHSYITQLVRSGANPKVVQALARHSTITLTLDRYTHVEDGDLRAALDGLTPAQG